MSEFELTEQGDGRFGLTGDVSFATAEAILRKSNQMFAQHEKVEVDLSAVEKTDSAGLALLLEWISLAAKRGRQIRYTQIPEKIHAIAVTAEIDELLESAYSSSASSS